MGGTRGESGAGTGGSGDSNGGETASTGGSGGSVKSMGESVASTGRSVDSVSRSDDSTGGMGDSAGVSEEVTVDASAEAMSMAASEHSSCGSVLVSLSDDDEGSALSSSSSIQQEGNKICIKTKDGYKCCADNNLDILMYSIFLRSNIKV